MSPFGSLFSMRRFAADRRANVAMIFGISALVLVGLTGMGVDYYTALSTKSQLDLAADAASIEAITTVSSYIKANPGTDVTTAFNAAQPTAVSQGQNAFIVNAGKAYTRTMTAPPTPVVTLGSDKQTISASVAYTAASPNAFGPLFNVKKINMSGTSSASLTLPKYLDFYMLLDMSGSMGFPSTTDGQGALAPLNPDMANKDGIPSGCVFACHFSDSAAKACTNTSDQSATCQGYQVAATNGIQLRAQAVGDAIGSLITNAKLTMQNTGLQNQFRLGIYPFIKSMDIFYPQSSDTANYPYPSNNLDAATTTINNLGCFNDSGTIVSNGQGLSNLIDEGSTPLYPLACPTNKKLTSIAQKPASVKAIVNMGSGGTNIKAVLGNPNPTTVTDGITLSGSNIYIKSNGSTINPNNITRSVGNGSQQTTPLPFVVLVTDGVQNGQCYGIVKNQSCTASVPSSSTNFDGSTPSAVDPTWCNAIKAQAYLAVLYIVYEPIPIHSNDSATFTSEDTKVNNLIPGVPNTLQQCASPGFYFTATDATGINNAMVQIFYQAVDQVAHLTH